ncbi:MAG: PP2C family protein-serine/threonine phosphatase [Candidatus Spyradocola sp.]|jgi:serine/threonine protein phosphatase PrpC
MPIEIVILLLIAVAGIAGSIVLLVFNASLRRPSLEEPSTAEEPLPAGEPVPAEAPADSPVSTAEAEKPAGQELRFTPLDREPETQRAARQPAPAAEAAEPAAPGSTVVGDIALSIGNVQDIGTRDQQQDAFAITPLEEELVVRDHGVMAVVCDGMGGMENGAEAANLGAIQFMRAYLAADKVDGNTLVEAVYRANEAVYGAFAGKNGALAGTTLVAASILPDGLRFVSVGDSHIYLFRKGKLYQLNRDHNYFSELLEEVKAGRMTMEEARANPERAHLTSFVGLETLELVDYNVAPVPLRPGDRVILCSDGLFKTLSLQEMTDILGRSSGFTAQDELLAAVRQKGKRKQDNVTVVLLYCDPVK